MHLIALLIKVFLSAFGSEPLFKFLILLVLFKKKKKNSEEKGLLSFCQPTNVSELGVPCFLCSLNTLTTILFSNQKDQSSMWKFPENVLIIKIEL